MEDLKTYWSHNVGQQFSSFGHRIEATRMLGSVLALNNSLDINEDALVETTEASLVASLLHFPVSQQQSFPSNDYDDLTFQAQMILYLYVFCFCLLLQWNPNNEQSINSPPPPPFQYALCLHPRPNLLYSTQSP